MKGEKLYQNMTAKKIMEDLNAFVNYYKKEEKRIPLCMVAAIEYIWLNEERKNKRRSKNAKKEENNINTNGRDPVQ